MITSDDSRRIPQSHYLDQFRLVADLGEQSRQSQLSLLRTFLSLQSTLLAVLVALRPTTRLPTALLVLYLVALGLLLLGSIVALGALYALSALPRRSQEAFRSEVLSALHDGRRVRPVALEERWTEKYLPTISAILLVAALLALTAFAAISLL